VTFTIASVIYKKELCEALRGRRTLFIVLGLPLLFYPILTFFMKQLHESHAAIEAARVSEITVWGPLPIALEQRLTSKQDIMLTFWGHVPPDIRRALENGNISTPVLDAEDQEINQNSGSEIPIVEVARKEILEHKTDAVVIAWPDLSKKITSGGFGVVSILFDSLRPESVRARDRVANLVHSYCSGLLAKREKELGLEEGFSMGLKLHRQNVTRPSRESGQLLGLVLPFLLILVSAVSGFHAAIDMTAGEKERGTLPTLLCAPLQALEVIAGKLAAAWTVAIISTIVNLIGAYLALSRLSLSQIAGAVSLPTYLAGFSLILPITMMFTALFLTIGILVNTVRDAQNLLTPVLASLLFPLMVAMIPGLELNASVALVPILGMALLFKGVFIAEWHATAAVLVVTSSLIYAGLAVIFAAYVFDRMFSASSSNRSF
jgi:sodium transport system permease protein